MESVEILKEQLARLEHRLDMANHNDSLGMAATISSLYGQVGSKRRELELAEAEASNDRDT